MTTNKNRISVICEMTLIRQYLQVRIESENYRVAETSPTFCDAAFNAVCLRTSARNVIAIMNEMAINPAKI